MNAHDSSAIRVSSSPEETRQLGRRVGEHAAPGDVISLTGDLGSGKTTLTQGIATGLGLDSDDVRSPTFVFLAEFSHGRIPLYHLDAYRLGQGSDVSELGLDDYIVRADGLLVVEWGDCISGYLPSDHLVIQLDLSGEHGTARDIALHSLGPRSERLLASL